MHPSDVAAAAYPLASPAPATPPAGKSTSDTYSPAWRAAPDSRGSGARSPGDASPVPPWREAMTSMSRNISRSTWWEQEQVIKYPPSQIFHPPAVNLDQTQDKRRPCSSIRTRSGFSPCRTATFRGSSSRARTATSLRVTTPLGRNRSISAGRISSTSDQCRVSVAGSRGHPGPGISPGWNGVDRGERATTVQRRSRQTPRRRSSPDQRSGRVFGEIQAIDRKRQLALVLGHHPDAGTSSGRRDFANAAKQFQLPDLVHASSESRKISISWFMARAKLGSQTVRRGHSGTPFRNV